MNFLLRRLVLWLLIAALPIQGFAASARLCCDAEPMTSYTGQAAAHHDVSVMPPHHVHAADGGGMQHASPEMKRAADKADSHHHKADACSTCAACSVGTIALPTHVAWSPSLTKDVATFATPSALVTGFIPDGPERPPRQLSA